MESKELCSPEEFIATYQHAIEEPFKHGYYFISSNFRTFASQVREDKNEPLANALDLCACILSMKLNPESVNEPFSAFMHLNDKRSAIADDFNAEEVNFIASILNEVTEPMIQARFADLLWLLATPKNVGFVRTAIQAYISLPINPTRWLADENDCWERAVRLAKQIRDNEVIEKIESSLITAFRLDYPDSPFMRLWIGELIERCGICRDDYIELASTLFKSSQELYDNKAYQESRSYLELAATLFQRNKDEDNWLAALVLNAECHELEGDSRSSGDVGSQMVANSFYENALQAYRRIPAKHREKLGVNDKLISIRDKITEAGVGALDEMGLVQSPKTNIKDLVEQSIKHVEGKETLESALLHYTGFATPKYQNLKEQSIELMNNNPLSSLFGSTLMANDGRVIAKTPSIGLGSDTENNEEVLNKKIIQSHQISIQIAVQGQIIPGLNQILSEFRVSRRFIKALCEHSPIVGSDRVELFSSALWLGFEHDFGNAIHLLCPQVEHMIRMKFKGEDIITSNVDLKGIENENGLSTLLDNERAEEILGEDLLFDMKAIFTDSVGDNLRNNCAHGLLNDHSASSYGSVYAWWMILRLVVRSLYEQEKSKKEDI
jgi:tetratricopeptide (TPR) repeat protein